MPKDWLNGSILGGSSAWALSDLGPILWEASDPVWETSGVSWGQKAQVGVGLHPEGRPQGGF